METLAEYAERKVLFILCKERAKYCRKNGSQSNFALPEGDWDDMSPRKFLSTIMPPRSTWVHPRPYVREKRFSQKDGSRDLKRLHRYCLERTIERDREKQKEKGAYFAYLERLDAYVAHLMQLLREDGLHFERPQLHPLHKSTETATDGHRVITYRPLSVYTRLDDKIVIAITSMYLSRYFNSSLHENILSYRPPRTWKGEKAHITDFNDGVRCIADFRAQHEAEAIYAADCDIKKFYDSLHHDMIRECVQAMMAQKRGLSEDGKLQIMRVLDAYLDSYNFYDDVLRASQKDGFWTPFYQHHRRYEEDECRFGWLSEQDLQRYYGPQYAQAQRHIGVPQGGALSLNIANIVLNHVDRQAGLDETDSRKLFLRFCDDMILLHTDQSECERLMKAYCEALEVHKLVYHPMQAVEQTKDGKKTSCAFWNQKSHSPFLWAEGEGNCNRYVGFLGYEIRRDGQIRLRKSNEQKWTDKWQSFYYAILRQTIGQDKEGKKFNRAEIKEMAEKIGPLMEAKEKTKDFYTGFDWDNPEQYDVRQWVHIHQRQKRMLRKLRTRLKHWDERRYRLLLQSIEAIKKSSLFPPL